LAAGFHIHPQKVSRIASFAATRPRVFRGYFFYRLVIKAIQRGIVHAVGITAALETDWVDSTGWGCLAWAVITED